VANLTDVDVMEELRRLAAKTPDSDSGWTMAELREALGLGDRRARALAARAMSAGLLALGRRWVKYINGVERWTPVYVPVSTKEYRITASSPPSAPTAARKRGGSSRG